MSTTSSDAWSVADDALVNMIAMQSAPRRSDIIEAIERLWMVREVPSIIEAA